MFFLQFLGIATREENQHSIKGSMTMTSTDEFGFSGNYLQPILSVLKTL